MTELLIYEGKAALALVTFYIFYRLLLSKETFHRFNRIVLLGTAAMAFVLPLCVITISKTVILPAVSPVDTVVETVEGVITGTASVPQEPIWPAILLGIFVVGALAVMLMTVISIIKVMSIIRSGEHHTLDSGETLVITENGTAPFSWMKYIVLSREDYESGYSQILTHEKAHIALKHSWDLLFVDLITVLQWFNPVIWMLKSDLRALHEFEADDAVLRSGANIKEYQYLLIKKAVSKSGYSVANSFNHSTLKARITMMLNKKSSRMSAWKALYVLPLVGISLAATAKTKVDYQYEGQQPEGVVDTLVSKDSENWYKTEHKETESSPVKTLKEPDSDFTKKNLREGRFVDKENNSFTLHYFNTELEEVRVQYTGVDLNKNIYMHNGAIVTQEMMMEAAKEDPEAVVIVAYLKDNNRVSCALTTSGLYLTGKIDVTREQDGKIMESKEPVPFQHVAQKPTFNGGDANEFSKWVAQNLIYPEKSLQSMAQGRVTLQFTITEIGKVTDVKVLRGVNEDLNNEAVRVVSQSPLWTPGKDANGEVVRVSYTFPVIFKFPEATEPQKSITVRGRDENGKDIEVSSSDLVIVVNEERMPPGYDLNTIAPETITSMEVLKTEDALKEYGTEKGVIKITVDPSKKGQKKPVPDIYINGKKATSEEVAALPPNPKGHIAEDGTMHIYTDQGANEIDLPLEVNN